MAKAKYGIDFEQFDTIIQNFEELQDEKTMTELREKGLQKGFNHIQSSLAAAWHHSDSGITYSYKINSDKPLSRKDKSSIGIGFIFDNDKYPAQLDGKWNPDIHGGLAVQFLIYGTPRLAADKKLYNSMFSSAVRKEADRQAEEAIHDEIIKKLSK